jgi:hypothetical protein
MVFSLAVSKQTKILDEIPRTPLFPFMVDQIDNGSRSLLGQDTEEKTSEERSFSTHTIENDVLENAKRRTLETSYPAVLMEMLYQAPCSLSRTKALVLDGNDFNIAESRFSKTYDFFNHCVPNPTTSSKTNYGTFMLNADEGVNRIVDGSAENTAPSVVKIQQRAEAVFRESEFPSRNSKTVQVPLNSFHPGSHDPETESDADSGVIPPPIRFNWQCSEITMSDFGDDMDDTKGTLLGGISIQKQMVRRWNPAANSARKRDCNNLPPQRKDSRDSWDRDHLFSINRTAHTQFDQFDSIKDTSDYADQTTATIQRLLKNKNDCSTSPATRTTQTDQTEDTLSRASSCNHRLCSSNSASSRCVGDSPLKVPQRSLSPISSPKSLKIRFEQLMKGYDGDCDDEEVVSRRMLPFESCGNVMDRWDSIPILSPFNRLKITENVKATYVRAGVSEEQLSPWKRQHHSHNDENQLPLRMPRRQRSLDLPGSLMRDIPAPPFA